MAAAQDLSWTTPEPVDPVLAAWTQDMPVPVPEPVEYDFCCSFCRMHIDTRCWGQCLVIEGFPDYQYHSSCAIRLIRPYSTEPFTEWELDQFSVDDIFFDNNRNFGKLFIVRYVVDDDNLVKFEEELVRLAHDVLVAYYQCTFCGELVDTAIYGECTDIDQFPDYQYHTECAINLIGQYSTEKFTAWELWECSMDEKSLEDGSSWKLFYGLQYVVESDNLLEFGMLFEEESEDVEEEFDESETAAEENEELVGRSTTAEEEGNEQSAGTESDES